MNIQRIVLCGLLVVFCGALPGQTPNRQTGDAQLTFTVASVKPHPDGPGGPLNGIRGGPGTDDPGQISYIGVQLSGILTTAYKIYLNQLTGPDWLRTERYDIIAKVPAGTTKDQLNFMLRNLLSERFNMKVHHELKEQPVYELVVGKNGSKLRDAAAPDPSSTDTFRAGARDGDGFPVLPAGRQLIVRSSMREGLDRIAAQMQPIWDLIGMLNGLVDRPIIDKTGLTGKYDFKLAFLRVPSADPTAGPNDGGLDIFGAVQEQLGLKLESTGGQVDHLIIDHIDKVPTEN